jgi:hypothetical protein
MVLFILLGLILWVAVAWWMLANSPPECLDWRDQILFALWPVTVPAVILWDVSLWLFRKVRTWRNDRG